MFKKELNRRDAFKISSALGVAGILGRGGIFDESLHFQKLKAAIKTGSAKELAYAAECHTDYVFVQFVMVDKFQAAVFNWIDPANGGTAPIGLDSYGGIFQQRGDFQGMALAKPIADKLAELPPSVSVALANGWTSGSGGHSLQNSRLNASLGGVNNAFEVKSGGSGLLGVTGFSINSDANNSADVHVGANGLQLATYQNVSNLASTLESSVSPLKDAETNRITKILDTTVTKDTAFRDTLVKLAEQIGSAVPAIKSASTLQTARFGAAMGGMMNNNGLLNDVVMQQANAAVALYQSGVCRNFMIGVPYDDTNGGGNLANPGGSAGYDPLTGFMKYVEALVYLHQNIPNLVTVSSTDGGRGQNNGDQANGFAVLTGPDCRLKPGFIDGLSYTSYTQLGNNAGQHRMSNGGSMVANNVHTYATALKLMGIESGEPWLASAIVS
jgi:hypothetical protein